MISQSASVMMFFVLAVVVLLFNLDLFGTQDAEA